VQTGSAGYSARGVIPRTISYLFREIEGRRSAGDSVSVRVSYLEIYNEVLYDLLREGGTSSTSPELSINEDRKGATHIRGLTLRHVPTEEDALGLLFEGETNRAIAG
jgi:kinesin family protein 6/9